MITIGEFSRICSVTTKTLRYYDDIDLIKPVHIAESGYRYYHIDQLKDMLLINRLKHYGFSLDDIRHLLSTQDETEYITYFRKKNQELLETIKETTTILQKMQQDIENMERGLPVMTFMKNYDITLTEREPVNILYSRQKMSTSDFGLYIGKLFERIGRDKLTVLGNVMTIYHDPEFNQDHTDMEVAVPVAEAVTGTRDLAGGLCATLTHKGTYSDLGNAYARLMEWMEAEGYEGRSAPFEIYQNNPNPASPEDQITEVYMPVRKK